jgi:hypothetical protein
VPKDGVGSFIMGRMHPPLSRTRRARTAAVAVGLVAVLSLAGCGGKDAKASSGGGKPDKQSTTGGQTLQAYYPLTGLPIQGQAPTHPPVVVKIDNTYASQPQEGMARADLITEELVEGGLTRLAVFFDTNIPKLVGPVRSMRASDIGLVKPVKGVVVTSGAAAITIGRLNAAGVNFKSNDGGAPGFYRDNGRRAPYNLMMRLPELVKSLKKSTAATSPYLDWGTEADFKGTEPATHVTAHFGSGHTTEWAFQGGHYVNTNSNADKASQFRPDTVVVIRVDVRDAGYTDPANNPVPESVTTGHGNVTVFHAGKAVKGTWSKAGPTKNWVLKDAAGAVMKVPAGHTWVEVLPKDAKGGSLSYTP